MPPSGPVDHVVTSGTFSLDGGTWDVDNNVWVVGDENEVLVVDAAHDPDKIAEAIGGRRVVAVVCTHAHDDHVNSAPALADRFNAPILLNPAEAPLWEMTHPNRQPDRELADGDVLSAGGIELRALVTPGHSPGSTCLYAPELKHRVHRGHPVRRWAGGDRALVLLVRGDHLLDPGPAAHAARGHHRAHRARRLHHHRRRDPAARRVDRARPLM